MVLQKNITQTYHVSLILAQPIIEFHFRLCSQPLLYLYLSYFPSLRTNKQNKNLYKVKENADLDTSCLLIGVMVFVSGVIRSNFLGLADLIP